MALTDGLLLYYKKDGDANDATPNAVNGSDTSVTYSNGKINEGANYDTSKTTTFTQQTPVTVSFWVNLTTITSKKLLFATSPNHSMDGDGSSKISLYDGSVHSASNAWVTGSWQFYVFVYSTSPSNGYDVYLNGAFLERIACNQLQFNQMGRVDASGFTGSLDEVGMWSRALTPAEVAILYNSGYGNPYPLLIAPTNLNNYKKVRAGNGMSVNLN